MTTFARGGGGGMPPGLKTLLKEGIVIDGQTIQVGQYVSLDGDKVSNELGQDTTYAIKSVFFNRAIFTLIDETYGILVGRDNGYNSYIAKIDINGVNPTLSGSVLTVSSAFYDFTFTLIDSTYGILVSSSTTNSTVAKIIIDGTSPTLSGSVLAINGNRFDNPKFINIDSTYGALVGNGSASGGYIAKIRIDGKSPMLSGSVASISSGFDVNARLTLINNTYGVFTGSTTGTTSYQGSVAIVDISGATPTLSGSVLRVGNGFSGATFTLIDTTYGILAGSNPYNGSVAKINISGTSPTLSGSVLTVSGNFSTATFTLIDSIYGILTGGTSDNGYVAKIGIDGESPTLSGSVLIVSGGFSSPTFTRIDATYGAFVGHQGVSPYNATVAKIKIYGASPTLSGSTLTVSSSSFYFATFTLINSTYGILVGHDSTNGNGNIVKINISGESPTLSGDVYTIGKSEFIEANFTLIDETYGILVGRGSASPYSAYSAKISVDGAIPAVSGSVLNVSGAFYSPTFTLIDSTYGILAGYNTSSPYNGSVAKIRIDGASPTLSGSVLTVNIGFYNPTFTLIDATYGILTGYNNTSSPYNGSVAKIRIDGASPTLSGSVLTVNIGFYNPTFTLIDSTYGILAGYSSGSNGSVAKINIIGTSPTLSGSVLTLNAGFYNPTFKLIDSTYGILAGYNSGSNGSVAKINIIGTSPTLSGSVLNVNGNFQKPTFTLIDATYGILAGYNNTSPYPCSVAKINITGTSPTLSESVLTVSAGFAYPTFTLIDSTYGILAGYNRASPYNGSVAKIKIDGASPTLNGSILTVNAGFQFPTFTLIDTTYGILAGCNDSSYTATVAKININGISPVMLNLAGIAIETKIAGQIIKYIQGV